MPTLTRSSTVWIETPILSDAADCWRGNWGRMLVCRNSPNTPATSFLPVRIKWIRACFHPCFLSLIQKPITSDFPLQERKKWNERQSETQAKAQRQSFLDLVSYMEMPVRKKNVSLFPRFMYSAPWMTKLHDEISTSKRLYPQCSNKCIQNKLIPDWNRILIVPPLKMHMLSYCLTKQVVLLFFIRPLRIWSPVLVWLHCNGVAYTHRSCCVFMILYLQNRHKKNTVTLCMKAGEDRHLTLLRDEHILSGIRPPLTLWSTVGNPKLSSVLCSQPSPFLPASSPQLETSRETFLCCCFGSHLPKSTWRGNYTSTRKLQFS